MWPWGHLAVGYLAYTLLTHLRFRRAPTGLAVLSVTLGTQFPDIIDKPLSWTFHVLPTGRSLAHSLFTAAFIIVVAYAIARRRGYGREVGAFGLGYLSHLLADGYLSALQGNFDELTYAVYPLYPLPTYETDPSFLAHFLKFELTSRTGFELLLVAIVLAVWVKDGMPGLTELKGMARRLYETATLTREGESAD